MGTDQCERRRLLHYREWRVRVHPTLLEAVHIGAHPADALALPLQVAQLTVDQCVRNYAGISRGKVSCTGALGE